MIKSKWTEPQEHWTLGRETTMSQVFYCFTHLLDLQLIST